jgi:serine/threonine protein kinase
MSSELQDIVLGNRYNLLEKIGEGGMALVYKAKCQLLNRYVAVKILRPEFTADEEFIKKFKRESLAAASLSHPNIVGIYDVGEQEGIYYIVMEYICGKTLKEYIKENGKLNYREVLNITNQIGNALEHAHKNGVIHRDIKPHNILVTEDKIIKVTDFGIARASNSSTIANTGSIMGSVHYFSPEQARGGFSDHRTDIYSLGVVVYEMLTGSLPYDAESPVTVAIKHIQEDFLEPTRVDNTIPEAINDIVIRSMEKDMTKRYQSIKELIEDIDFARNNPYQKIEPKEKVSQLTQTIPIEEIDNALNKNNKSGKNNKKNKSKKIIIIASIILVACLGLFSGMIYFYNHVFIVPNATIPHITGLTAEEAKKSLEDNKLVFLEGVKVISDKPEGEVVSVSPQEGTLVKVGSTVTVIESKGAQEVSVPDLTNKSVADAEILLDQAKLVKGDEVRQNSDTVPKDLIISQEPILNSSASIGSKVNITVSDGPVVTMVAVPLLMGKTLEEAEKAIGDAQLKIGDVSYEQNNNITDGVVMGASEVEGTQVPEGTPINLTISQGENSSSSTPAQ